MLSELENDIREEKFKKYIKYNEGRSETWEFFKDSNPFFCSNLFSYVYFRPICCDNKKINKI